MFAGFRVEPWVWVLQADVRGVVCIQALSRFYSGSISRTLNPRPKYLN